MRRVKFVLPFLLVLTFAVTGCNTIENRRSLYSPKKADGPYTRALQDGTWDEQKTVDEQYAESQRMKKQSRVAPAAKAPQAAPGYPQATPE
jgi:hypothetical protein